MKESEAGGEKNERIIIGMASSCQESRIALNESRETNQQSDMNPFLFMASGNSTMPAFSADAICKMYSLFRVGVSPMASHLSAPGKNGRTSKSQQEMLSRLRRAGDDSFSRDLRKPVRIKKVFILYRFGFPKKHKQINAYMYGLAK